MRRANTKRHTRETEVTVDLSIDGSGQYRIDTGIGFFDHMLSALSLHSRFDLNIQAAGDLYTDAHHTIEDVSITLGQALHEAMGSLAGINRMGHAYVPMDEALAFVAVDFSGRPYSVFQANWNTPLIGQYPTAMTQHFFESLASNARMTLHARVEYGRDDHHQTEALFKALGRALWVAASLNPSYGDVPSTKGTLTD
jgi:imidazoleglycerol-phosphate dehydratase